MQISDFDYPLPEALIARYPATERRASRLLEVGARLVDRVFADLPALLRPFTRIAEHTLGLARLTRLHRLLPGHVLGPAGGLS